MDIRSLCGKKHSIPLWIVQNNILAVSNMRVSSVVLDIRRGELENLMKVLTGPDPFIDIEKAMRRSVNLMLSVLHGSKILNTFSTTRCDELLQDSQSNFPSLTN